MSETPPPYSEEEPKKLPEGFACLGITVAAFVAFGLAVAKFDSIMSRLEQAKSENVPEKIEAKNKISELKKAYELLYAEANAKNPLNGEPVYVFEDGKLGNMIIQTRNVATAVMVDDVVLNDWNNDETLNVLDRDGKFMVDENSDGIIDQALDSDPVSGRRSPIDISGDLNKEFEDVSKNLWKDVKAAIIREAQRISHF